MLTKKQSWFYLERLFIIYGYLPLPVNISLADKNFAQQIINKCILLYLWVTKV